GASANWYLHTSNTPGPADIVFQFGPAGAGGPSFQLASAPAPTTAPVPGLRPDQLNGVVANALVRYQNAGLTPDQLPNVIAVNFVIPDMAPGVIGQTVGSTIYLSRDAAGYGWFVDPTPDDDSEFTGQPMTAISGGPASGKIDLLTVVLHELAHEAGVPD